MAITLNEAKVLEHSTILYHGTYRNADGTPARFRVSGKTKTWKTRPNDVEFPTKYGMYGNTRFTQNDLENLFFYEWEATGKKLSFKREVIEGSTYYNVWLDNDTYGIVFKENGLWYNTRVDRDKGFITRLEAGKHILNCMYC